VLAEEWGEKSGRHPWFATGIDHWLEVRQIVAKSGEEVREAVMRQEVDVFRKKGEDAAHQERGHDLGGMILFEGSGKVCQVPGDVQGNPGRNATGVE